MSWALPFSLHIHLRDVAGKPREEAIIALIRMREDILSQERRTISALKYVINENITALYSFVLPRILVLIEILYVTKRSVIIHVTKNYVYKSFFRNKTSNENIHITSSI